VNNLLTSIKPGALHRARLDQITWRQNDLQHELTTEPVGPSQAAIDQLRRQLADVFRHGTPGQRKAVMDTHIAEITLNQSKIIPVFRVPAPTQTPVDNPTGGTETVRSRLTMAPRGGQNANRFLLVRGAPLPVAPVRDRVVRSRSDGPLG